MQLSRRRLLVGTALAGLTGCARPDGASAPSATPAPPAPQVPTATATAGAPPVRQPRLVLTQSDADAARTLASFERLDDHPMYAMTWYGAGASLAGEPTRQAGAYLGGFACTLWVATGTAGRPIVGRNWDWDHGPALALTSHSNAGSSLTLNDMTFLGLGDANPVDPGRPDQGRALARAHAGQVEGINQHGLFMGIAADEGNPQVPERPDRPLVGGLGLQRLVLDRARTVDEALALIQGIDPDFTGGPPLHYLLADAAGGAASVECDDGAWAFERRPEGQPWWCVENFHLTGTPEARRRGARRYGTCATTLDAARGAVDTAAAFALLDAVRQGHTQWSSVYDLASRSAVVRTRAGEHRFSL